MDFKDCVKFANENKICYMATADSKQPRVRGVMLWYADQSGFYFNTNDDKSFYKQLKSNQSVEICFHKKGEGPDLGTMMRIAGNVEFLDDVSLRAKALEDKPFLKQWGYTPQSPELIIFRIPKGEAHFWTMPTSRDPKVFTKFGK